ncbi:hypothetical protein JVU11DRAFT_12068 [Chiua virens]|nr:hypothetical protein JVU11DRAFT_12068 [Chiua virens]
MRICLIPPSPHPTILYGLTFPSVLALPGFSPNATIGPAWSSQLQLLSSVLQLEPPSNIHMLDRAVGLVARVEELCMDVPQKEIMVKFVDGRAIIIPMNSDCVRILLGVAVDVKGCNEPESQRSSMESGAYPGSTTGSIEDPPPSPTKSSKRGKHKRQRSLLFSLISLLVPKSLSSSSSRPPPPSSVPPPTPLPPLPTPKRVFLISPQRPSFASAQPDPEFLRKRARAALIDVWRRHVVSALTPQHLPAAGYIEWTLISMASKLRAEIDTFKTVESRRGIRVDSTKSGRNRHRKTQSESRTALDFGDRTLDCESQQWRCRAPSPYPGMFEGEDSDRVVYPRQDKDEWGVRYVHHLSPSDDAGHFLVDYDHYNDSLLGEPFAFGDDQDDNERLPFELGLVERYDGDIGGRLSNFGLACGDHDGSKLADTRFDLSRSPLIPSDVKDDGESDDSQVSLRTPEEGEALPLGPPVCLEHDTPSAAQPGLVSRVASSCPRPRIASAKYSRAHSTSSPPPTLSLPLSSSPYSSHYRDPEAEELIASRLAHLDQICAVLEIVRSRAREEGWRQFKATMIGAKNDWMDTETERSLESKAKRRAWSSGIKISAPYSCASRSAPNVWDGSFSTHKMSTGPSGLTSSRGIPRVRGPIVPTGLSLGIPVQSSPLAKCAWGTEGAATSTPSKYGDLGLMRTPKVKGGKKSSRVHFADSVTKLLPVREDESEDAFEPEVTAFGFPQAVPVPVSSDGVEVVQGPSDSEDALYFCPTQPRVRTTSIYVGPPSPPPLPMFRPSTPPPIYQAAVGGDISDPASDGEGRLDASALLLHPLSSLSISSSQQSPPRPSLISNPSFVPRPRAVSLPTARSYAEVNKTRRISDQYGSGRCEDLSQAYASPPPEGPLVVSATPAPHEQYPRYAHIQSPIPSSKKSMTASILGRVGKEVAFEQNGSEFTVGIEVALGRAEEGRVVW